MEPQEEEFLPLSSVVKANTKDAIRFHDENKGSFIVAKIYASHCIAWYGLRLLSPTLKLILDVHKDRKWSAIAAGFFLIRLILWRCATKPIILTPDPVYKRFSPKGNKGSCGVKSKWIIIIPVVRFIKIRNLKHCEIFPRILQSLEKFIWNTV